MCNLYLNEVTTAQEFAAALWELIPEENGTGYVTYDRADLFLDVRPFQLQSRDRLLHILLM